MLHKKTLRSLAVLAALTLFLPAIAAAQRDTLRKRGLSADTGYQVGNIDHVNLFNGNMVVTIPIGINYPVGPNLSYQLNLIYNSYSWDHETMDCPAAYEYPIPEKSNNGGFGWTLSMGRLLAPEARVYGERWKYVAPDGSHHGFYNELHDSSASTANVQYSHDSNYLRFRRFPSGSTVCESEIPAGADVECAIVEMSNGNVMEFRNFGGDPDIVNPPTEPDFRHVMTRDPFGNWIKSTYNDNSGSDDTWVITDSHDRTHTVNFADGTTPAFKRIKTVDLASFSGGTATYTLNFGDSAKTLDRQGFLPAACNLSSTVDVLTLDRLILPDNSFYEFTYYEDEDADVLSGGMESLRLPTGGKFEWTYKQHGFIRSNNNPDAPLPGPKPHAPPDGNFVYGVETKKTFVDDGDSTPEGIWTYDYAKSSGSAPGDSTVKCHNETIVTDPLGHQSVHYFSTSVVNEPWSYGLPFTRCDSQYSNTPPFLSVELFEGSRDTGELVRSTYVDYDSDKFTTELHIEQNSRLKYQKTVFHDDDDKYRETTWSDFDNYGHYQTQVEGGDFSSVDARTTTVNYEPIDTTNVWLLNNWTERKVTVNAVDAITQACFDSQTGFLSRTRTLVGDSPADNDILHVFIEEEDGTDGLGRAERHLMYGGDVNSGITDNDYTDLCEMDLPAEGDAEYRTDNTYTDSVLSKAVAIDPCDNEEILILTDNDIDANTGLVSERRDAAGISTVLTHDTRGRLVKENPTGIGAVRYVYVLPTTGNPDDTARLTVLDCPFSNSSCGTGNARTFQRLRYDGLGRMFEERIKLPTGPATVATHKRQIGYNAMGWKIEESQWADVDMTGLLKTVYSEHDRFGRVGKIQPPDVTNNPDTKFTYAGERIRTKNVKIQETTGEKTSLVTEVYNARGLLLEVCENRSAAWTGTCGGVGIPTLYSYDVGDRLTYVCANASGSSCGQERDFIYDNRGFLVSETHPELNNLATTYSYDSRGNVLLRDAPGGPSASPDFDLEYLYDPAGRLTQVWEANGGSPSRLLKEYFYGYANHTPTSDYRKGKLIQTIRYNWIDAVEPLPFANEGNNEVRVSETFQYQGPGGRVSARQTRRTFAGLTGEAVIFNFSQTYNDLGLVEEVTYPDCSHNLEGCASVAPPRKVKYSYTEGFLTKVEDSTDSTNLQGIADSLTYQAGGMLHEIIHGNGVTETVAINSNDGMQRPERISTSAGWDTGLYDYDGAGNIASIGTLAFAYDRMSRLVKGHANDGTADRLQEVEFDDYGNITKITTNGLALTTATSTVTNRLTGLGSDYDRGGNLTNISLGGIAFEYTYDAANMMKHFQSSAGQARVFLYNVDDERLVQADCVAADCSPSAETYTVRDFSGRVLRTFKLTPNAGWEWEEDYVYNERNVLATIKADGAGEETRHFHVDHLGSVRQVTDGNGNEVERHNYYPFGEEATSSSSLERMRFTGHERDLGSAAGADDLDYMHARYCSPRTSRFHSPDPIVNPAPGTPQRWNRYAYTLNNPVNFVDPDGREIVSATGTSAAHEKRIVSAMARAMRNPSFSQRITELEASSIIFIVGSGNLDSKIDRSGVTFDAGRAQPNIKNGKVVAVSIIIDLDALSNPELNTGSATDVQLLAHELAFHGTTYNRPDALQMSREENQSEEDDAHAYGKKVEADPRVDAEPSAAELANARKILSLPNSAIKE